MRVPPVPVGPALAHLVGCNGFLAAVVRSARARGNAKLAEWRSSRRCDAAWGKVVRPDTPPPSSGRRGIGPGCCSALPPLAASRPHGGSYLTLPYRWPRPYFGPGWRPTGRCGWRLPRPGLGVGWPTSAAGVGPGSCAKALSGHSSQGGSPIAWPWWPSVPSSSSPRASLCEERGRIDLPTFGPGTGGSIDFDERGGAILRTLDTADESAERRTRHCPSHGDRHGDSLKYGLLLGRFRPSGRSTLSWNGHRAGPAG
jgi:hypothetical protein